MTKLKRLHVCREREIASLVLVAPHEGVVGLVVSCAHFCRAEEAAWGMLAYLPECCECSIGSSANALAGYLCRKCPLHGSLAA